MLLRGHTLPHRCHVAERQLAEAITREANTYMDVMDSHLPRGMDLTRAPAMLHEYSLTAAQEWELLTVRAEAS